MNADNYINARNELKERGLNLVNMGSDPGEITQAQFENTRIYKARYVMVSHGLNVLDTKGRVIVDPLKVKP